MSASLAFGKLARSETDKEMTYSRPMLRGKLLEVASTTRFNRAYMSDGSPHAFDLPILSIVLIFELFMILWST